MTPPQSRQRANGADEGKLPRAAAAALISGLGSLALYLATLAPTVLTGNDAELIAAAHVLGIAHPTGYPLYLLLAKAFELLPVAGPPLRVALLSAVCGAGAAAAVAWAGARLTGSVPAGVLAGLVCALNAEMWTQATMAEVYALNALIVSLAVGVFVRWSETRRGCDLVWLAVVTGAGLAHHRTALFFTGPLLLAALVVQRPKWRALAKVGLAGAAPLLLYLYLPLRAAARPPIMWSDVSSWGSFIWHVSGRSFQQAYALARPWPEVKVVAAELASVTVSAMTVGGVALAAIGLVVMLFRHRLLGLCLVVGSCALTVWNLWYLVPDWEVFFIPCFLTAALWAGVGLAAVVRGLERQVGARAGWAPGAFAAVAVVALPASLIQYGWGRAEHRGDWRRYDETRAVMAQMGPDSVYVTDWDAAMFWYLQVVEGCRTDVDVVSSTGVNMRPIADARLAAAVARMTAEHIRPASEVSAEAQRATALPVARGLADALGARRPIYCEVEFREPPTDPRIRCPWWNLIRVFPASAAPGAVPGHAQEAGRASRVSIELAQIEGPAASEFEGGVSLARMTVEPRTARPGEPLRIACYWRCAERIARPPFVLVRLEPTARLPWGVGEGEVLDSYGTWLMYGITPLEPTPPGTAYRQELRGVVPTNGPTGRWQVLMGVAERPERGAPPERVAEFEVLPRERTTAP